jgi:hypothetical protein
MQHAVERWSAVNRNDPSLEELHAPWANESPKESMRRQVEELIDRHLAEHTRSRIVPRTSSNGPTISALPQNLLGFLWTQFAENYVSGHYYRRCKRSSCGKLFLITHDWDGATKRREHCSPACKQALYRQRSKQNSESGDPRI